MCCIAQSFKINGIYISVEYEAVSVSEGLQVFKFSQQSFDDLTLSLSLCPSLIKLHKLFCTSVLYLLHWFVALNGFVVNIPI